MPQANQEASATNIQRNKQHWKIENENLRTAPAKNPDLVLPLFADLVLALLPELNVLRRNADKYGNHPFFRKEDAPKSDRLQLAVMRSLCHIRQVFLQNDYVNHTQVFEQICKLSPTPADLKILNGIREQLTLFALPDNAEVEAFENPVLQNDLEKDGLIPVKMQEHLQATPRFMAGTFLYGYLLHRNFYKVIHYHSACSSVGPDILFWQSCRYAEDVCSWLVSLAMVWLCAESKSTFGESEHYEKSRFIVYHSADSLRKLKKFLKNKTKALKTETRPWSITL